MHLLGIRQQHRFGRYPELSEHSALSHGDIDFQEVGYRPMPLDWGFFDWEMCRIAPIYFDIATVHYQLGIPFNDLRLSHYVQEVGRLSGVKLDAGKVMELMDVGLIFCLQRWTRVAWNHETHWSEEGLEDTFRRGLDKILLTLKRRRSK